MDRGEVVWIGVSGFQWRVMRQKRLKARAEAELVHTAVLAQTEDRVEVVRTVVLSIAVGDILVHLQPKSCRFHLVPLHAMASVVALCCEIAMFPAILLVSWIWTARVVLLCLGLHVDVLHAPVDTVVLALSLLRADAQVPVLARCPRSHCSELPALSDIDLRIAL